MNDPNINAVAQRAAELAYENIKALYPHCVPPLLFPGIWQALTDAAAKAPILSIIEVDGREELIRTACERCGRRLLAGDVGVVYGLETVCTTCLYGAREQAGRAGDVGCR